MKGCATSFQNLCWNFKSSVILYSKKKQLFYSNLQKIFEAKNICTIIKNNNNNNNNNHRIKNLFVKTKNLGYKQDGRKFTLTPCTRDPNTIVKPM